MRNKRSGINPKLRCIAPPVIIRVLLSPPRSSRAPLKALSKQLFARILRARSFFWRPTDSY
ncbi:conserved hypothetical protein [Stutzerimonas stutzeri A1501]|uniref:Uncharacterized protein n=1 Tax=Stutzerimonas stutzeri (strain A1501) TaxID=379731 RepID=A4VME1_STUS1|nr:conserved hypothetical protein [Stutzerimonas stutzeri A1501]